MANHKDSSNEALGQVDQASLIAIILELREITIRQAAQIQTLQDQLAKNSQNSGKPPSSDGLKKVPRRSLRQKGKRASGGQTGHEGHSLEMVAQPDEIVYHSLSYCPQCCTDLSGVEVCGREKRQVFDVPPLCLEVTEHQAEIKVCPQCGEAVKALFPQGVSHSLQYGSRLKVQAVYLNTYQLLPLARICELFEDWYGHTPSPALILNANALLVEQTELVRAAIKTQVSQAEVAHYDESGVRVEGGLKWLHVVGTNDLTYYALHPKRGQAALHDIGILPAFKGWAVHDGWASYFQFEHCPHALCNAHHLRELHFIVEQYQQPWAQGMIQLLLDIKAEVEHTPLEQGCLAPDRLADYEQRYEELLRQGFAANPPPQDTPSPKRGRLKQSPAKNLLDRLQTYRGETLAFMYDLRVPFDNNLAERDLRMMKVKQKISGTFRTPDGAEMFCAIRTYISTVRKQGGKVIQAICDALLGHPFMPCPLALPE